MGFPDLLSNCYGKNPIKFETMYVRWDVKNIDIICAKNNGSDRMKRLWGMGQKQERKYDGKHE